MSTMKSLCAVFGVSLLSAAPALAQNAPQAPPPMTFFVTSVGSGRGADLGGLAGADAQCQKLAGAAGAGRTWRAYLSTQGPNAVNARDRIGKGPWHNARGALVGQNIEEIHGIGHQFTLLSVLDEAGRIIPGSGVRPEPARHPDGFAAERHRLLGRRRHDLQQLDEQQHRQGACGASRPRQLELGARQPGCSQQQLQGSGGDGLFYCFAAQ